jgi:uncharacterized protein
MLVEFSVENVLSYREKTTFSMVATTDKALPNNIAQVAALPKSTKSQALGCVSAIYGANASGKSNLFKALYLFKEIVAKSANNQEGDELAVMPFKLDQRLSSEPSIFSITLIHENIRYYYECRLDAKHVYDETLMFWPESKPITVFERTNTTDIKFAPKYTSKALKQFTQEATLPNTLLLSKLAQNNHTVAKAFSKACKSEIQILSSDFSSPYTFEYAKHDTKFKTNVLNALKNADFSIIDFYDEVLSDDEIKSNEKLKKIHQKLENEAQTHKQALVLDGLKETDIKHSVQLRRIVTSHARAGQKENKTNVIFSLGEESDGTIKYLELMGPVFTILKEGATLLVDELDSKLHPLLVKYIITLFTNPKTNANHAQLVFTTHNIDLLDLSLFRRDQIWFTDRNPKTLGSELTSLAEFSARKDLDIKTAYLQGRFNGVPIITPLLDGCDE